MASIGNTAADQPSFTESQVEGFLSSIYGFSHLPCSDFQCTTSVQYFCGVFDKFVSEGLLGASQSNPTDETVQPNEEVLWPQLTPSDHQMLRHVAHILRQAPQSDIQQVHWFPEYGCALLTLYNDTSDKGLQQFIGSYGQVPLTLVCLDSWQFKVHSRAQDAIEHTADCDENTLLHGGEIAADQVPKLLKVLQKLLKKAQDECKGDKRTAAVNEQGHQKTPAFIYTILMDALDVVNKGQDNLDIEEVQKKHAPRGGFIDVGLHTGGKRRDTSWPLVREVIKTLLTYSDQDNTSLYYQAMAHFHLWMATLFVANQIATPSNATPFLLNAAMKIMQVATGAAAELAHQGHNMIHFEVRCQKIRDSLDNLAAERAKSAADRFELPSLNDESSIESVCGAGSYRLPSGKIPDFIPQEYTDTDPEARETRSIKNLDLFPLFTEREKSTTFSDLVKFRTFSGWRINNLDSNASNALPVQHMLCAVEKVMFERAASGLAASGEAMTEEEIDKLTTIVDNYREVLQLFKKSKFAAARMEVDLRSREILITWIAFCLIDARTVHAHPVLKSYGVALRWQDLRHLVLNDKAATDAALSVAAYLRSRTNQKPVFSLRDSSHTFQLAEQVARSDQTIVEMWENEQRDATAREQTRWEVVLKQKEQLKELRARLVTEKEEMNEWQVELNEARNEVDSNHGSLVTKEMRQRLSIAKRNFNDWKNTVINTEWHINNTNKAPEPIIQPLPSNSGIAFQWLFFLYMPPLFRHLSRMTFLAQQLLFPREFKNDEVLKIEFRLDLAHHYKTYRDHSSATDASQTVLLEPNSNGQVFLLTTNTKPNDYDIGSKKVDRIGSSSDGVWHPDTLAMIMGWTGSGSSADAFSGVQFNPFTPFASARMVESFSEKLPREAESLQWALHLYGGAQETSPARGNMAIATQDQRPTWLSKPGYLDFGSLRAYPLLQIRKLCVALHGKTLPLDQAAVQTLVRQALYHLGQFTDESVPQLLWRSEWNTNSSDLLQTLHCEIAKLADDLAEMPRAYQSVGLLGEVSAFLSEWYPPFHALARRFATMAKRWADDLEVNVADAATKNSQHTRAKQLLLRMTALTCYANGSIDAADAQQMLNLVVLINHGRVFEEEDALNKQIDTLHVRCQYVMAKRIAEVHNLATSEMMTAAIRLVLQRAPEKGMKFDGWCWDSDGTEYQSGGHSTAGSIDGHLYGINIANGTVLLDGWPHQRLPKEVMQHPLYLRTFGNWNFEVAGSGVYKTSRPVKGHFYEFYVGVDGDLVILEIDDCGNKLQLLDTGKWANELPVRLKEMHSHWLHRERRIIVLRPKDFKDHNVHFILQWDAPNVNENEMEDDSTDNGTVEYICRRVPSHYRSYHWERLLVAFDDQLGDQLVLHESKIMEVLSKFEDPKFIHCYIDNRRTPPDASDEGDVGDVDETEGNCSNQDYTSVPLVSSQRRVMLFEFARYGLQFELTTDGHIDSLDHLGYCLAPFQQLASPAVQGYTLTDFQQYLVLRRQHDSNEVAIGLQKASIRVLVPAGRVLPHNGQQKLGHAGVYIEVSDECSARHRAHIYDVHERFHHLTARSILSRLQLAALYAATGSLLPETGSRRTGAQMAMELLRQCWTNRPLTEEESTQLASVSFLGRHMAAALPLIAYELEVSASQLNHLHYPDGPPDSFVPPRLNHDESTAYLQERKQEVAGAKNCSLSLTATEEERVLGRHIPATNASGRRSDVPWLAMKLYTAIEVPECPVNDMVRRTEKELRRLVRSSHGLEAELLKLELKNKKRKTEADPTCLHDFPLTAGGSTPLEIEMYADLKASWEAHHAHASERNIADNARETVENCFRW